MVVERSAGSAAKVAVYHAAYMTTYHNQVNTKLRWAATALYYGSHQCRIVADATLYCGVCQCRTLVATALYYGNCHIILWWPPVYKSGGHQFRKLWAMFVYDSHDKLILDTWIVNTKHVNLTPCGLFISVFKSSEELIGKRSPCIHKLSVYDKQPD